MTGPTAPSPTPGPDRSTPRAGRTGAWVSHHRPLVVALFCLLAVMLSGGMIIVAWIGGGDHLFASAEQSTSQTAQASASTGATESTSPSASARPTTPAEEEEEEPTEEPVTGGGGAPEDFDEDALRAVIAAEDTTAQRIEKVTNALLGGRAGDCAIGDCLRSVTYDGAGAYTMILGSKIEARSTTPGDLMSMMRATGSIVTFAVSSSDAADFARLTIRTRDGSLQATTPVALGD